MLGSSCKYSSYHQMITYSQRVNKVFYLYLNGLNNNCKSVIKTGWNILFTCVRGNLSLEPKSRRTVH